jgi:hypothetical protein
MGSREPGAPTGGASGDAHQNGGGHHQDAIERLELAFAHFVTPSTGAHCGALGREARLPWLHVGVIGLKLAWIESILVYVPADT